MPSLDFVTKIQNEEYSCHRKRGGYSEMFNFDFRCKIQ